MLGDIESISVVRHCPEYKPDNFEDRLVVWCGVAFTSPVILSLASAYYNTISYAYVFITDLVTNIYIILRGEKLS